MVLRYGQKVGVFGTMGTQDVRLDLSLQCVKREAAGHLDTPMTRLVLVPCNDSCEAGLLLAPVLMGQELAILDEEGLKRVNLGSSYVKSCPAKRNNQNTRLVCHRLNGPSQGPICFGHVVGLFTESGHKRLDMSTMGDANQDLESRATRVFIQALSEGDPSGPKPVR